MCANSEGMARLRGCAGALEPSLVAYAISIMISITSVFIFGRSNLQIMCISTEGVIVTLTFYIDLCPCSCDTAFYGTIF